jgi:murein DD-endopeptidase MepM/ murein hydrolase activator NlpD
MIVRITSKFGSVDRVHSTPHKGVDLAFEEGTPLRSISDGIARVVDYGDKNIGKGVIVEHADGSTAIYGHLSRVDVRSGEVIHKGEELGLTGNTGHSTGAHLHFGYKEHGQFVDPTPHVDDVMRLAGEQSWLDKAIANGKVGNVHFPTIKEWLYEHITEASINGIVGYITDLAYALPILAVVCGCSYYLINMFSKRLATWGALGTLIYGLYIIR